MAFGKRQSGAGPAAQALNVNAAAAPGEAVTEGSGAVGHPFRWFVALVAFGALLYGLVHVYGPDIVRDLRLSGTWQPAYDLRAADGKCERKSFIITFCSARIKSVAMPDQAPVEHRFMMLFSSGNGEAMVPVRSTVNRAAVSIHYSAEAKLWNRTLSFIVSAVILVLFCLVFLTCFWRSANSFE
jgi:hypothetical protein